MQVAGRKVPSLVERALVGGIVFLVLVVVGAKIAESAELIPSVGIARPAEDGDAKLYAGLAVRTSLAPFVQSELGVAYRTEELSDDATATTWPITASAWFSAVPFVYGGGGVGWYHTSFKQEATLLTPEMTATQQAFGFHVGGGLRMPLAPMIGLDLNTRYVMLERQDDAPSEYDPKFWSMALGLGVKF